LPKKGQDLRKANAFLRYYLQIEPNELSDDEFAMRWNELIFVLKAQGLKKGIPNI